NRRLFLYLQLHTSGIKYSNTKVVSNELVAVFLTKSNLNKRVKSLFSSSGNPGTSQETKSQIN
ncbi:MAG: hypothetical protein ABIQ31_20100, partial [Ferruginibacter sp.]